MKNYDFSQETFDQSVNKSNNFNRHSRSSLNILMFSVVSAVDTIWLVRNPIEVQ